VFLNDQETAVDLLYYESVAKTVVKLVRSTPLVPVTIGVHGDWGAGKSSVLKMTAAILEKDKKTLCIWFNGWAFEGFEDAKTVVIEKIVEELLRARPGHAKVAEAAKKVFKRIDWLKVAKKTGGLAFTAMTGIPTFDQLESLANAAKAFIAKPGDVVSTDDIKQWVDQAGEFVKDKEGAKDNVPHQMHKFREEFEELIEAADIEQLVVLVDDLDRCLPETAIATLEAIRLFLFVPRTAFVIGADEMMIEYAVRSHFPDLPAQVGQVPYARNYLEKLVQVPFRIPALGTAETRIYVILLLAQLALGEQDPSFKKLLDLARSELKKPWATRGLDVGSVTTALGAAPSPALSRVLNTGVQISNILAEGTKGNPRQIKRFLNSVLLRFAVAEERGFSDQLEQSKLAKVMLAESFAPVFYLQLARMAVTSAGGQVLALAQLEASVGATVARPTAKGSAASAAQPEVEEWSRTDWIKEWAAIAPPLGTEDLRPYVFATRDKRNYLGGLAAASHLDALVDRLLGSRMAAKNLVSEIDKLAGTEPEQVFDALQTAIRSATDLSKEPPGLHGMVALVTGHPKLQRRLGAFLAELPAGLIGAWATTNFSTLQTEPELAASYRILLEGWATQSENSKLRAAAQGAMKLLKAS
jgi:predicted KAP-like P-loop ATPase